MPVQDYLTLPLKDRLKKQTCNRCGRDDVKFFSQDAHTGDGKRYVRKICTGCTNKKTITCRREHRHITIYWNCYKSNLKRGESMELTKDDVKLMITRPCEYCGTNNERNGIDRKNNEIGYTLDNSVPCCIRCNALKRDMPLIAWNELVPIIKSITQRGLFGDWVGHPSYRAKCPA
jgi:hypothetical protein